MYRLKYYSDFKDINDNPIRIEIYKNSETVISSAELTLSAEPISIEYTADDIYKPLKQSCCSINVLTKNVLLDLYTGTLNDVMLKVFRSNSLFWMGYLTPNIYSSEFTDDYDLLTLEFVDSIAQLENTKFTTTGSTISSFYSVIRHILDTIDAGINKIYLHNSLALNGNSDMLNKLYIQERNFFDEEGEAETNKEVMEDILSYLGMSLIQFEDKYLILDYEALKNNNYSFTVYDRTTGTTATTTIASDVRNIKDIGVAESNATISLGNVYNKVNVIANTNQIDDTVPELFDDLTNQNTDPNKYYETAKGDYTYLSAYFNSSKWGTYKPVAGNILDANVLEEVTVSNVDSIIYGSFFQKNDSYKTIDGEPSSISWEDAVTLAEPYYSGIGIIPLYTNPEFEALTYTKDYAIFKNGYIILNFNYMFSNSHFFADTYTDKEVAYSNTKFSTGFNNTKFMCKLMIGDYYWTGERWANWNTEYLPVKDKYENSTYSITEISGVKHYYYTYNGIKTEVTLEEYNKMRAQDRFYLVHQNKEGDLIFNTWKPLTNQVSYKDNLVDSEDGVLIPLPNNVLYGSVVFKLYAPYELGRYANYRTDGSGGTYNTYVRYCHLKDMKFVYTNNKNYTDIFSKQEYDPDILYNNVINDANITELDDITLKVNTYSTNATSYSYVLAKSGTGYDFVDSITNKNYNENKKMEESIIRKYVEHYKQPKFIYTNTVNDKNIKPYTIIHEDTINKNLVVNAAIYDLMNNAVTVTTVEL